MSDFSKRIDLFVKELNELCAKHSVGIDLEGGQLIDDIVEYEVTEEEDGYGDGDEPYYYLEPVVS